MLKDGEKGAILQRDKETYAVAPHIPCGVVAPDTLRKITDAAEKYGAAALKITSAARIAIVGLKEEDVDNVWADLGMSPGAAVGICVRSVKACPGTGFCKRGMQDSLGMGMYMDATYHGMQLPGKLKIGVSGCPHQCAETAVKDIGIVGSGNGWKVLVGGCAGTQPRIADILTTGLDDEGLKNLVTTIIAFYQATANPGERIGRMIVRIGLDAFKQGVGVA